MQSVGEQLQRARLAKGMTLEELSQVIKVSCGSLKALEEDDYNRLPAAVFVRGFVRAYGTTVGLDADQLVRQLPYDNVVVSRVESDSRTSEERFSAMMGIGPRASRGAVLRSSQAIFLFLAVAMLVAAWLMVGKGGGDTSAHVSDQLPEVHERVEGVSSSLDTRSVR